MPNKKYTMLLDGEERQVSIDKFEKYGPSMYAERFSGASIRMRNDKGEDYAVPVNDYQRALDSGFRPYVTSYYKDKKEELESHDESVADSVVYLSDSPDPNKPIHVEIPESIRTQYGFTPEETGPNEQALPDNIRQKADDESLFEENRRRFAEGKPLKGVTTQSIIDANPELGLKRTKQYSEEVLQRSRENVPDYFKSKKDMSLMDLPLGVPGDMLSDEGSNARIDAASKYYQSDSFKDRVKKETGERVEDLYSQTRADLKSIEERISNRESALRNENWRPGMPSTRDDGNLAELRGQRTILSTAENILEDSRKIVEEAGKKDSPWYAALGRGVKDKVFDVDAWTMGISDMAGSMNLNKTLEKADKGEGLTSAEQRLLDAAVTNMAVNAYYSSGLSAAYKAGQVTGESIPFMLEMAVNPISASGNATAKLLLKYGMKKFGREMAKNVGKTAAAAAGMTATTGLPGVIGGAYDRVNGQVQFGLDDKGKLVYTGRKGGMGAGEAFAKSAASRFLENHSEMVFNAFKGMGDEVWRGVQKVVPEGVDGFIQKAAQTGAGRMIREYGNNELMKEAAKRTQFHGILGEYLEEVYNNLANVPLGEMTMDQVLDLDRNIETFLGLAPTSVFFGVLGLGGMAAERANHRLKMNAAFGSMTKVQRDKLAKLERLSKMNGNADIRTFIKETMADPDLSKEQKRQEIEYAYDIAVGNAYDEAADEQVRIQEEARSAAQEDGQSVYASGDTAAIRESVVREDVSRSRLEEVLPDAAAIDALLETDDVTRAEMLDGLPEEVQERAKDLLRDHDRRQAVEDAIDEAHLPEFEEAEARVQEMTRNGRVTIIPLGRFGDPKHSFGVVINGLDESGNVTTNGGLVMVVPLTNGTNGPDFSSFDSRRAEAITLDSSMERQEMEPDSVIESLLGSYKEDVDKLSQPPIVPGQTYTILDGYGKPVGMQVQGRDEQGNWLVLMEGQKIPLVMPEDTILEMLADAERASVIAEYEADDAAKAKGKAAARESLMGDSFSPEVMALKPQVNEEIKIGGIRAQISEVGPDGITVRYIADNGTVSGAGQIPMEEYYAYKQSLFDSQKDQARKDAAAPDLREESSSVQAEKKDDYKQGSNRNFVSMGMEKAERILGDIYGEKMPRKVAVTAKAYADDVVKAQKAVEKAQEAYDNAPIGREGKAKETLDKAKANYEAVKNEADFWAEMDADIKAAQAEREAMLNPQVDVDMSEQPMTVDEFVAQQLANGNITLTSESFKKETGFGEKERKKFPKMFRKAGNGGMTIERAGERLMEIASEEGLSFFDQDDANAGRDALINFLGSVYSWGDVAGYVRNSREAMAKRESDAIRDEMEAFIWNNFHMTPEEYATQREIEAVENPYGNVDLAAIDAIFAEKEFESQTLNEETNESGRITEGNQGESGILSEEQVGDNGGNQPSEEERETEGTGNGTQDESEAAQAAELTQKEGESVLDFAERAAEENRRRPLRERANEWSKSLGVKAIFLESIDEVDARTRATIEASHVEGAAVPGWVAKNGEVFFFMPDLRDMKDIDETYIHEVVAHIGMERLLGKERFAELCDKVWDMMPQAEKNYYFYQYPGVKEIKNAGERKRRAADEYIAHLAEKQNLTPEEKTIWDNIVKAVRELLDKALNKILSKSRITDADIESLVRASYANMKKDARVDVSQKLEQARSEVNQKPTEKQKEAGNYKKGHVKIDGFDITIENPKGGVRSGTDKNGKKWSITMNNDYGYIRGTEAVDGDHIDVFLSSFPTQGSVFVVDQSNEDGSFDESKVMYGFSSLEEARAAYLSNYEKGWESRIMAITEVSKEEFKKWIDSSRRKTKAFSEYKNIKTAPSIEETNVSRMADIEARILEIEGRRNEISDELAETPDYDALKVAELRAEEWGLDQEQSELEAEYSGLRSMNDESNAILENEGSNLRFSAKKKRALETVSTSRKKHQQTVISSADGAKILNNLDNLAEKYENDTHTKEKTFIGEVAKAIEARKQGSGSQYATFETVNGNVVTIRLADHNATVSNFDNRGENEGISIVVSAKDNNGITNDGAAHIVEYFYDSIDLRRAEGKPLAEIVKSIKQSLYSGEYKDTTGLAERQEVNESRFRVVRDKNGKKTLVGLHNISESKLKKAIKQGGLANPSMAVIDLDKQSHVDYGDITLIAPSSLIDKKSGKNIGTYTADAWTPIYPNIEKRMSDKGAKAYSKSLESVPSELRNKVRLYFNAYLEDGNTSGALNYWFLHDTGKNPPLLTSQSNDYTNEELDAIEAISNAEYYSGLNEEKKQKVLDLFIEKQGGKDAFDAKIAERIETMKNNLQRPDLKAFMKNKVEQKLQEIQEYGYDYEQVSNFYSNAQRAINNRGKIDEFRTFRNAQDIVNNEGLQGEFNEWLADKEEQFGVEEYLFVGYNNNGDRKYLPNTLENASKLMKKEGRAGATGLHGFNHFVATLAPNAGTLAQINKKKGNLSTEEEYDAFREKWGDVYHELAKQLQPDATGYADYGYYRLEEMPTVKNPKEYIKKEYGIELSDEFMKKYNEFVSAIKNDFPARYFETKFERPVYLNEFAAAVVPQGTSKDVVDALTEAGLPVEEYEKDNNEARMAAVDKVSSEMEGVRFRVTFSKEEQSIIDKAKSNGTYMKAPNGKLTNLTEKQWVQVRTKAFKKWFGDWEDDPTNASKVVDENGEPLIVYHGTDAEFEEFDKTHNDKAYKGFFFTEGKEMAASYGKNIMEVFLNIREAYEIEGNGRNWNDLNTDIINYVPKLEDQIRLHEASMKKAVEKGVMSQSNYDFFKDRYYKKVEFIKDKNKNSILDIIKKYLYRWQIRNFKSSHIVTTTREIEYYLEQLDQNTNIIFKDIKDYGKDVKGFRTAHNVFVTTSPNQIKSATDNVGTFDEGNNDIRFRISNQNQEIFVSNAQKAVEGIKQEKATPQQWLAMIEKNSGLKAGEDKWLGLSDWLKASEKKSITKAEILDFIGENKIVIEEVKYVEGDNVGFDEFGGSSYLDGIEREFDNLRVEYGVADAERKLMENHPGIEEFAYVENGHLEWDYDEAEIAEWINKDARVKSKVNPINSTRLEYTTKGLENKAEIALTVPAIESWNEDDEVHFGDAGEGRAIAWIRFGETTGTVKESSIVDDYLSGMRSKYNAAEGEEVDYMSEDEIKHLQSLTSSELNAKENAPRILVIDEIQSKRHQEGRDKGYRNVDAEKDLEEFKVKLKEKYPEGYSAPSMTWEQHQQIKRIYPDTAWLTDEERREYVELQKKAGVKEGILAAPFEKNWSELAFKRMLRYAAENGFDKVAWTTGAQQAERYNIGTTISKAKVSVDEDGSRLVTLDFRHDEGYMDFYQMRVDSKGVVTSGDYSGSTLADVVGKEFALKVMGVEKSETFTGDGLVVGGEGMKGFYDKMLPSFVNKYVKKWGTKVQDIELPNVEEAGRIMHSVDVTEAMKESVMEGQTMFRVKDVQPAIDSFTSKYNSKPVVVIDSNMPDKELKRLVGFEAKEVRDAIELGMNSGYNPKTDKIYIMTDNVKDSSDLEDSLFHENLHQYLLSDKSLVVEFFADAEDAYKKNIKQIKEQGYKAYEVPEELFVRVVADSQVKGNFAKVFSFLSEEGKEKLTNLLKENGYDIARETEIRTSGRMDGSGRDGSGRRDGDDFGRVAKESSSMASPSKVEKDGRTREIRQLFDQVADNGLRGVVGDKAYDSAMFEMYRSLPMEARERVAMDALNNHGADMGKAMDKLISESYDTSLWDVVVGAIRNTLRKKGYNIHFSENDIRYLVWRNRQKLNPYSIIDKAEDINKRVVLGTGDRSDKPDGIRFREKRPLIVRRYDEAVNNGSFRFQEAFQDSMLSLKVLMEIIEQETGKKAKTFENAYTAENRLSSVNKVDNEKYIEEFFTPLMSVIKRLSDKFGQKSVEDYIYAKSGLERNEVLKKRDADKAYAEALEDLDEKLRKGELSDDQYDALKSNAEIARSEAMSSEDDYAGLRGLLFNSKAHELDERLRKGEITEADYNRLYNELESKEDEVEKDFKSFAETIVNDFESSAGRKDVDDLWDKINAATNETLRKDYESGMIDKETYEATRDMMEYYVPLRGWSEKTAEEVYDYHHTTAPIQKNQKTAKGRRSQADNPITSIAQMAQNAIVRGNRNKMKQRLFNFVVNRPTALATFQEGWFVKNNASGDFELEYPVIEEGDTAEDIQKKMDEFERRMEELSKDRQAFKGKLPFGSPYRIQSKQKNEHIVPVMINGREYGIYINGNPRAAQAVNGMTNPEASNMLSEMYEGAKRFYSAGLTSWNPDFLMANAVRDGIHSTVMTFLDKGPLASAYFLRDIPKCIKTIRAEIFGNGSSDPQMHQYFDEFVNFGGETGYTAVHTLEDYKKEYEKMLRNLEGLEKGVQFAKEGFSSIAKWMEQANRMFEDISRFNAYQSARKSGRSVEESVDAAKNITVNFNKKGALGTTKGFWGSLAWFMNKWILFFNPTVQGITQIYKSAKKNPKRFNVLLGTILGSGVLVPFLNSMVVGLLGGDEEDYWLQNDYNRMNNLLLKNPAGEGYFKVPLPPTFREIYGMGDIFYRLMTGRISPERASVATLRQLQLLTGFLNVIPDDEPDLGKALIGLAPDVLAPLTDIVVNQDFTGRRIAKITDYNKYSPEYQRVYKGVSPFYVEISRYINKIGGDDVSRAPLYGTFINPAYMEHIITGYTGGIGKTLSNVSGIVADAVSGNFDENFDLRKIPVASRFYSVSDESTVRSAVNRKFREYQSRFEKISYDYKKYSEAVRSGKTEFSVEIERMDNNGEKAFVDYFRKKQKSLNKKLDRLKNNPEDKTLEQEITDLKAEIALKCYELLK